MRTVDIRLKSMLMTIAMVCMVVLLVEFWPKAARREQQDVVMHEQDSDITALFDQAVNDLRARHYHRAIEGFHVVLQNAPTMPEAYVNMGFAYLELKRYELAKQAFNTALDLRSGQINAYWGLAVSAEGLCDIPAAIGAMRTFVHLAKPDDPYLPKANAALWEWSQLKSKAEQDADKKIECQ